MSAWVMMDENTTVTKKQSYYRFLFIIITIISALYFINIRFRSHSIILHLSINQSFISITKTKQIRCIVWARERVGRLGNRMFLLASGYGLARLHSCHFYLTSDIIDEMKTIFLFNFSSAIISSSVFDSNNNTNSTAVKRISKYAVCEYFPELTRPNAIEAGTIFELQGYWQSYLHFAKYSHELRENVFVATQPVLQKVSIFFADIYEKQFGSKPNFSLDSHHSLKNQLAQSNLFTWIRIHIRRTDLKSKNYSSDNDYILFAVRYYASLYPNMYFIVASDDKFYCRTLFRQQSKVSITPRSFSPADDLIALSLCQHSIVTGGTFSWWSAYLAHGGVLHDKTYPSGCERREYYYPPWYMIDGKVRANIASDYIL